MFLFFLKVVDVATYSITEFTGHEAPILCTVLDTAKDGDKRYLLSSSCDGSVKVWNAKDGSLVKTIDGLFSSSSDVSTSKTTGKIVWHPEGRFFAVPTQTGVKVFARETWEESKQLKPDAALGKEELFSAVCWSPDARYVLGATNKGQFVVWRFKDVKVMAEVKTSRGYGIAGLSWNGAKNEVAFIDNHGFWGLVENLDFSGSKSVAAAPAPQSDAQPSKAAEKQQQIVNQEQLDEDELAAALFEPDADAEDDDDDDDNENSFSIRQIKRDTGFMSDDDSQVSSNPNKGDVFVKPNVDGDEDSNVAFDGSTVKVPVAPQQVT